MSLFPYPSGPQTTPANSVTTSTDLASSLITYIYSGYVPAFRARGFSRKSVLDVSSTISSTGQAAKVTIAQTMPSNLLSDGGTRVLSDLPPAISTVTLSQDRLVAFGLTQLVEAFINGQATLPSMVDAAIAGLLNDMQEDFISTLIANAPNSVGTYGVNASETTFIQAVTTLIQNYMPREDFYAMLAPTTGAYNQFIQISRVTFAQERRNGSGFIETSPVIEPGSTYSQDIMYNGGFWSASQLVGQAAVSGSNFVQNIAWHPMALAVAMRPMLIPTPGTGATAVNMVDAEIGAPVQFLRQWNLNTQSEELVLKVLYGMSPAQSAWSVLIKSN